MGQLLWEALGLRGKQDPAFCSLLSLGGDKILTQGLTVPPQCWSS